MSHVFRLHKEGGADTLEGWSSSNGYGTKAIDSIVDPQGATYKKEITSIPSPFARIDLVKSAFRQVVESKDLDNQLTIHHKIVSDCLDVAEIFFNIEKLRDKFEIITWSKKDSLETLLNDGNSAHWQLARTIQMYLKQDGKQYNFDKMQNIYLLNYIGPDAPAKMNIVGATSPATLFFTSANNLSYVSKNVQFGNDRPFDTDFQPLYKRDVNFIMFWFGLRELWESISGLEEDFSDLFKEVDGYLDLTFKKLPEDLKTEIRNYKKLEWDKLSPIHIHTVDDTVEILGCELKCKDLNTTFNSDFYIDSDYKEGGKTPLVLPVDNFRKPLMYTQDKWDNKTVVPFKDSDAISSRKLPNDGRVYPYLTIGDFLEDTIVCNVHPLNSARFHDGGDENCEDEYSYLIPVKSLYFNYFKIEDLKKHLKIARCSVNDTKSVKVTLEIPITDSKKERKNKITYERFYYEQSQGNVDGNAGNVLVKNFALHFMPFLKSKGETADYRIIVADLEDEDTFNISVASNDHVYSPKTLCVRNRNSAGDIIHSGRNVFTAQTYLFDHEFSHIYLETDGVVNLIIPIFSGNRIIGNNFEFAIDFGTSNTHIEYRVDGGNIQPFTINEEETMIAALNSGYGRAYSNTIMADFLPDQIGKDYKFPTRTVLSEKMGLDWIGSAITAMAETNIPLAYQSLPLPKYNKTSVDLKWAREMETKSRISSYFENILILLRNKVLLNGGDLASTKIAWFYPSSMSSKRVAEIRKSWSELYEKYFGGSADKNVITMSESIAPYMFYKKENRATTDVVSIDIGGGTSDILIAQNGEEKYLTSVRFAANTIFDSLPCAYNPFVNKYWDTFSSILDKNNMGDIKQLVENLKLEQKPASEVIMLLFSLSSNRDIIEKHIENKTDYSAMLFGDSNLKILFLLFYTALIYHIAKIMKAKKLKEPRYLTFSGTGSKVLNILIDPKDKSTLEKYTKLIFEKVLERGYDEDGLDIIINVKNPKEVTCKGALINMQSIDVSDIEEMKLAMLGVDKDQFISPSMKYGSIQDDVLEGVAREIKNFTTLFYKLNEVFSFNKNFGTIKTDGLISLKRCFERDIKKYVKDRINDKSPQDEVEETLFFYPISGILSAIASDKSMLSFDE
jgi:hypothetical protein